MWGVTAETEHALQALRGSWPRPWWFFHRNDDALTATVVALGQRGEVGAVPYLAALLPYAHLRPVVVTAIGRILARTDARAVLRLYSRRRRHASPWGWGPADHPTLDHLYWDWHALAPETVPEIRALAHGDASDGLDSADVGQVLGLLTFHSNGRVREAAIRELEGARFRWQAIAFVLLRVNDWVPAIRQRVTRSLETCLERAGASDGADAAAGLARALPFVYALSRGRRGDHTHLRERIDRVLLRTPDALSAGVSSSDPYVRRECFAVALRFDDAVAEAWIERALADGSPMIRLLAAQRVAAFTSDRATGRLARRLAADPFTGVRRVAVEILGERLGDAGAVFELLFDANAKLRAHARRLLSGVAAGARGPYRSAPAVIGDDFAAEYRRAIAGGARGRRLAAALIGLSECTETSTSRGDAERIASFRLDRRTYVRRAAVIALAHLNVENLGEVLAEALADLRPSVSRIARQALRRRPSLLDASYLRRLLVDARAPMHVRHNALQLMGMLPRWGALAALLDAFFQVDQEPLRPLAREGIRRWVARGNRAFGPPSPQQLAEVRRQLNQTEPWMPAELVADLRHLLGGWD